MKTMTNQTFAKITNLKSSALYHLAVKAYNTAGMGPSSAVVNVTTKKPREYGAWGETGFLFQLFLLTSVIGASNSVTKQHGC